MSYKSLSNKGIDLVLAKLYDIMMPNMQSEQLHMVEQINLLQSTMNIAEIKDDKLKHMAKLKTCKCGNILRHRMMNCVFNIIPIPNDEIEIMK